MASSIRLFAFPHDNMEPHFVLETAKIGTKIGRGVGIGKVKLEGGRKEGRKSEDEVKMNGGGRNGI
jgi:hypothetical protein